jgi:hypothetical protein
MTSLIATLLPSAILATLIVGVGWLVQWVWTGAGSNETGADGD